MFYALVHYPHIDTQPINDFRREFDPQADLIEPHITFMFLVPDSVGEQSLVDHIESVLSHWRPFPIHLKGLQKSWDHWLFLTLADGNANAARLHRELYTGILATYHRSDIEFVPHISLGLFTTPDSDYDIRNPHNAVLDDEKYSRALHQAEHLNLDYLCVVDRLHLVKLSDDVSEIASSREFPLRR